MSAGRTFSFNDDDDHQLHQYNEQERLGHYPQQQQQHDYNHQQQQQQQQQPYSPYHDSPGRNFASPPPRYASASPSRMRDPVSPPTSPQRRPVPQTAHLLSDTSPTRRPVAADVDDYLPPPPPPHMLSSPRLAREESGSQYRPYSNVTTGTDNFGDHVQGGGINAVAQGVADRNPRESGVEAVRSLPQSYAPYDRDGQRALNPGFPYEPPMRLPQRNSYGSGLALAAGAATPGTVTPTGSFGVGSSRISGRSIPLDDYNSVSGRPMSYSNYPDSPYHGNYNPSHSSHQIMNQANINPNDILDDGDNEFMEPQRGAGPNGQRGAGAAAAAAAGAGAGAGVLGGIFNRSSKNYTASGSYDAVGGARAEKSEWLSDQKKSRKRLWIGVAIGAVIVLAIVGGIVGGVLGTQNSESGSSGSSSSSSGSSAGPVPGSTNNAADDLAANGDLDINSAEIQALMNDENLHKVFPGMDYTPWGVQYEFCHIWPPSQNNVTRDMAVLSQLTNVVRLYGTDCNQTEMVLHAIDRLQLTDMKIWIGVWIDTNLTTNDRQLSQMYDILEKNSDHSIFKGVIVGNEALYRAGESKAQSEQELIQYLGDVRSRFQTLGYDLPIATSDLGDNWNANLVTAVDLVMSNIHPFFAGVTAEEGAGWTWSFWQNHNVPLTANLPNVKQVISETGWPSGGGTDCGAATTCAEGAVASVDGMNTFMDMWVCQALENGTDYFWFEAFDEPWKVIYNTADEQWEDKWGLMDPGRVLKPGIKIPDCGGRTVGS